MIGIYKITNKNNGKVYIGQSNNIERRFSQHKKKREQNIDNYINVLGVEHFNFEILEQCQQKDLNYKEKEYIDLYNSQKDGYNIIPGGFQPCKGENNGRAKLTEQDVIYIRKSYNQHKKQKEIYEIFKDKITWSQFQAVWQGTSWTHVMPEVYTKENREWYIYNNSKGENSPGAILSNKEVLFYRKLYVNMSAKQIYNQYNLSSIIKFSTFQKILMGESYTYNIPVYKKKTKQWFLNEEPVSTISASGE